LRQRIASVTLQQDSLIVVRITEPGMLPVDARFGGGDLAGIDVIDGDGSILVSYDGAALTLLEPINRAA
jgi:hypothetical protein